MPDTEPGVEVAGESRTSADDALRRALLALKDLRARAERAERAATEPIAIIGIGCRFPAGANSPEEYWDLLRSGRDGVGTIPDGRWDHAAYFDPVPDTPGKIYTDQGGFIDQPVDQFDAAFFGIAPVEARDLDPQQRLLLEVTWEALEHAGVAPDRLVGSSTGVFVGFSTFDYSHLLMEYGGSEEISPYSGTGVAPAVAAGRLSYFLGLRGPSIALDTACSSSLVALSLAAQSLRTGGCRMAIAGGVNLMLDPQAMISLSMLHVLSPAGRCHTFGAKADGYVRGEGCGMVVLKRLSDAEADGDRILAVVRAAAVNHDGKSSGLTVPSGPAQREVIERALAESGLEPTDIDFVEAHGTGTHLGDPIEVRALDAVYSRGRPPERPLLLASAKTNIGHLEAAAGIAGVIKTVLSLQHEEIPPHLNCDELSPHIEWASMPIEVTRQAHPWKRGEHVRRGAVSGFGWGGTNAHVIIEEAPAPAPRVEHPAAPFVVALSARDDVALGTLAAKTAGAFERADDARDVAWTLHEGRGRFRQRLAVTAGSADEAAARLRAWVPGESATGVTAATSATRTRVAFVFTGQGAQLPHMGRALYEHEPVFRAVLDECDAALRPHLPHSLLDVLYGPDDLAHLVHLTQYTQPAMFALQCGLTALWRSWGVTPDLVIGHSIGEYAAAVAAGVMDLATGAELIAARGTLMGALPTGGKMVAVFSDEATVAAIIAPHRESVSIGSVNGATNIVISGDGDEIDKILLDLDDAGVKYRPLEVSHAFHSPLMAPMVAEFDQRTRAAALREPKVPFVSTVTGVTEKAAFATAAYWRDQVLATVRFAAAVESAVAAGIDQYLEIGPQPTLLGMIARIRGQETGLHPSLRPGRGDRSEREQILDAVGSLWAAGVEPNWRAIDGEGLAKVPAPTYPFQRQHYWIDTTPRRGRPTGGHPLLGPGSRVPSLRATVHEVDVSAGSPAWLDDHRLAGTLVMPGSAFAEMALAAAGADGNVLELLTIREPLVLADDGAATVQTVVSDQPGGGRDVEVLSWPAGGDAAASRRHAHATVRPAASREAPLADVDVDALIGGFPEEVDVAGYYRQLAEVGLTYGPTFHGLERLLRRDGAALGLITLPAGVADRTRYQLHPALLDACFHVLGVAVTADLSGIADGMFVPVAIRGLEVHRSGVTSVWCVGTIIGEPDATSSTIEARLELFAADGALVATIDTLEARKVSAAMWQRALGTARRPLYELEWQPRPRAEAAAPVRSWVILGDDHGVAEAIAAQLIERSATCQVVPAHTPADERARILTAAIGESADPVGVVHLAALAAEQSPDGVQRMVDGALQLAHVLADAPGAERRMWFVTQGGQSVDGEAPSVEQSILWGLGRVLANELPQLGCTCIDIDIAAAPDTVDHLVAELLHTDAEDQVALRGPRRLSARLVRSTVDDEPTLDAPYRLVLGERGSLDALSFAPSERVAPAAGEVAVEVRATGLNFRDVLNVLGMYPGNPGNPGLECAGVVTAVGDDVRDLAVGDHVFGIAPEAFDSHVVTPAHLMAPMPASITFAQAATLPVAYLTAIYGLTNLAGLRAGERVLIHAGAGGVGMAAIHLAQRIGAEVHATVGSAEKRQVMAAMGVQHVYSSRTLDFAEQIMAATGGEGIDVVLNSLADEFIDRSFEVLAPTGRFLEIGKRGIWTDEQAAAVRPNGKYHPYQLAEFLVDEPEGVRAALHAVADDITAGTAVPLPLRAFPAHQIEDAYRFMAQARHIGKVVVTHRPSAATIRDDGAYLVTGGLGGLGVAVAAWLAEQGARHITLTGRSAPSAEAAAAIAGLTTAGVDVRVVRADVTDSAGVAQMIAEATQQVPLRGVFHAAGVLDDGAVGQQTWERFERVLAPKVGGAHLLDEATRTLDLDHFVLFSSAAALFGSPGQANYAAANSALDALARRRRSQGLPALSINWGAWAEAGMAARLDDREQQRMASRGVGMLDSATALDALSHLLEHTRPQVAVMAIDWPKLFAAAGGAPPALLSELAASLQRSENDEHDSGDADLAAALAAVAPSHRRAIAVEFVITQLTRVLGLPAGSPIDGDQELAELGLDSLMSVELTNRLRASTGLALAASLAFDHPSAHRLADHVLDLLADSDGAAGVAALPSAAAALAIVPIEPGAPTPASSAQARLLFVDRLVPGVAIYNIPVVMRLRGALDVEALRSSIVALVARHETLRTNFALDGDQYMQQIVPADEVDVRFDVHSDPLDESQFDVALREEIARPFDLGHDAKLRAALYRVAPDEHVLAVTVHHIASDGWSIVRLVAELGQLYSAGVTGATPHLADLPIRYADWSAWHAQVEADSLQSSDRLAYWLETLNGSLPVLDLPTDHPRPALQSFRSDHFRLDLSAEFYAQLHLAARDAGVTPFVFLLAAYVATLARWSNQDDVVVGTASANRPQAETHDVVGMFVNMLAIRTPVDLDRPFTELLDTVKHAARGAFAHEDVPFDRIVEAIHPPRDLSRSIVFQATFILHNMPVPDGAMGGLDVDVLDVPVGASEYDLACSVTEVDGAAQVKVEFNADVFEGATVERLMRHWRRLLESALDDPSVSVGSLGMMPPDEQARIDEWSLGRALPAAAGVRLEQLVAATARQRAGDIAVRSGDESISFADLVDRSRRLAHALVQAGVRPGARVGVAVDRSIAMVVALLSVLEAGAAYVPLDPSFPTDRLAFMVADAGVDVVVVSAGSLDDRLDLSALTVIDVDSDAEAIAAMSAEPLSVDVSGLAGGGVAYVIYTSGSTGQPKGVEIEHASVVNFVQSMLQEPGIVTDDVLLAVTTLSFDISVLEVFCPLVAGATVVVASDADIVDGRRLARLIEATEPTVMQATPTTWSMLFDTGWAGSSQLTVLCGGEAMPVELGRRLIDCCGPVWNMFGPTETTIWSTVQRIDDATLHGANVPIGRPIANTVCRVLASNGELAPIGVPGELLIGGAGVARGYLDRDQLTAERFVVDPYSDDRGARLYRTGDIARWLPSGSIEFLGRSDFQVKVRGHRIELGEIESALRSHPEVVDVVVVADGSAAAGRLLAYPIYSDPDSSPAVADLRTWMQSRVPDYMVPSRFIAVEAFPLTANRKIDRNALPRPDAAASSGAEYVGPRDPVEQTVAGIIADTLELERVGINDDFFELGGHSLHATSVLAKIDDAFGIAVDLRSFFVTPTVAHLAAALTSDPAVRDRVHKVAAVRVRLASMTPEQVARELAARRGAVENRRS